MIKLTSPYITLGQLLKLTDWIASGGEAKSAVKTLKILINGLPDDRRGRKIYPGDTVIIEDKTYSIGQ